MVDLEQVNVNWVLVLSIVGLKHLFRESSRLLIVRCSFIFLFSYLLFSNSCAYYPFSACCPLKDHTYLNKPAAFMKLAKFPTFTWMIIWR